MSQLAQHFVAPTTYSMLTTVKVCQNMGVFNKEGSIFRIRIYDMDSITGAPSKDLCNEIIEIKTDKKNTIIDLEQYAINIPQRDFFVSIEWLKIQANERSFVDSNGKEIWHLSYAPSVGWTKAKNDKMEVWYLDYHGSWFTMHKMPFNDKTSIAISATLKY